eukprot:3603069-Rhodomonas_salina.3
MTALSQRAPPFAVEVLTSHGPIQTTKGGWDSSIAGCTGGEAALLFYFNQSKAPNVIGPRQTALNG